MSGGLYARMAIFKGVLDFNLQPHPLAWTQGPNAMEWKLTLQGIYGLSKYECFLMSGTQDMDFQKTVMQVWRERARAWER